MKLKKLAVDNRIRIGLYLSLPRTRLGVQSDIYTHTAYVVRLKILQLAFALFCNEVCNEFLLAVTYDGEVRYPFKEEFKCKS